MYVTYGFVYCLTIIIAVINILMIVFTIRPIRRIFFNFLSHHRLRDNVIVSSIIYIMYAIVIIILLDSIWTYYYIKDTIDPSTFLS